MFCPFQSGLHYRAVRNILEQSDITSFIWRNPFEQKLFVAINLLPQPRQHHFFTYLHFRHEYRMVLINHDTSHIVTALNLRMSLDDFCK